MSDKRIYNLAIKDDILGIGDGLIPIDSNDLSNTKSISTDILFKNEILDSDISNDYQLLTPSSIYNRLASETQTGICNITQTQEIGGAMTPATFPLAQESYVETGVVFINSVTNSPIGGGDWVYDNNGARYWISGANVPVLSNNSLINYIESGNNNCLISFSGYIKFYNLNGANQNYLYFIINGWPYDNINLAIKQGSLASVDCYCIVGSERRCATGYIINNSVNSSKIIVYPTDGIFDAGKNVTIHFNVNFTNV